MKIENAMVSLRIKFRIDELLPFRTGFFFISLLVAFFMTLVFAWLAGNYAWEFKSLFPRQPYPDWLNNATLSWYLDPITVNLLWGAVIGSIIFLSARKQGSSLVMSLFYGLLPLVFLVLEYLITSSVFKSSFGYTRGCFQESPITAFVKRLLGKECNPLSYDAMPSENLSRQLILFYTFILADGSKQSPLQSRKFLRVVLHVANFFSLTVVGFSRIYIGAHEPIDIAIAIGIGTVVFWLILVPLYALSNRRLYQERLLSLGVVYLMYSFTLLYYSKNVAHFIGVSALVIGFLVIFYACLSLLPVNSVGDLNETKLETRSDKGA